MCWCPMPPAGKSIKLHCWHTQNVAKLLRSLCVFVALRNDLLWAEQPLSWPWHYLRVWLHMRGNTCCAVRTYIFWPLWHNHNAMRLGFHFASLCCVLLQQICTLCTHMEPFEPTLSADHWVIYPSNVYYTPHCLQTWTRRYINRQLTESREVFKALKMAVLCFRGSNMQGSL